MGAKRKIVVLEDGDMYFNVIHTACKEAYPFTPPGFGIELLMQGAISLGIIPYESSITPDRLYSIIYKGDKTSAKMKDFLLSVAADKIMMNRAQNTMRSRDVTGKKRILISHFEVLSTVWFWYEKNYDTPQFQAEDWEVYFDTFYHLQVEARNALRSYLNTFYPKSICRLRFNQT